MTTFEGITRLWDSALHRPRTSSPTTGLPALSPDLAAFERHEAFFRNHIVDYNLDRLFAPLVLNAPTDVVLQEAGAAAPIFTLPLPQATGGQTQWRETLNAYLRGQMRFVKSAAALRDERFDEIHVQQTDTLSFFGALMSLDDNRTPWTLMLLDAILRFGTYIEMPVKLHLSAARPNEMSGFVQPIIQPPSHASFPSGHSVEAFAVATVLHALSTDSSGNTPYSVESAFAPQQPPTEASLLMRLAARIAENRTVAGVHFPADSFAGAAMGMAIGEYLVNALSGATSTGAYRLETAGIAALDFNFDSLSFSGPQKAFDHAPGTVAVNAAIVSPLLRDIWARARAEMRVADF
ncbi:phosphatase PAP2 family protein [Sulfitobacter sp. THAF37]|uniref:phosphatase PAP2 family protein n=1 Tax=Sulfitobacter sp. THAF37 TaxID=2587855 RepID=UPI0015620C7B|nr:phosphatase PAP2 family protein [Sulfitobacter sp. THAF37]